MSVVLHVVAMTKIRNKEKKVKKV